MRTNTWTAAALVILATAGITGGCSQPSVLVCSVDTPAVAPDVEWAPDRGRAGGSQDNRFVARSRSFTPRKQEEPVWCWAACAQMVHECNGHEYTQKELAQRIHGNEPDGSPRIEAAAYDEIMRALNPDVRILPLEQVEDRVVKGREIRVQFNPSEYVSSLHEQFTVNSDAIVGELRAGSPVVAVMSEGEDETLYHAYVLHEIEFAVEKPALVERWADHVAKDSLLNPCVYPKYYSVRSVRLVDPYNGESVQLSGHEFRDRVRFVIGKERARSVLEKQGRVVTVQ